LGKNENFDFLLDREDSIFEKEKRVTRHEGAIMLMLGSKFRIFDMLRIP